MTATSRAKVFMCVLTATVSGLSLPVPLPRCHAGRLELDAIEYYLEAETWYPGVYDGRGCGFFGKPGTLIKGNGTVQLWVAYGFITLGGTLRIQGVSTDNGQGGLNLTGSIDLEGVYIEGRGGINIQDADVRWNGGYALDAQMPSGIARSTVSFSNFRFQSHPGAFTIDTSNVSFHNSDISTDYECPVIKGSAVTLVDSGLRCGEGEEANLLIESSVLNLTRSKISSFSYARNVGNMLISNSTVHATCNGGVVMDVDGSGGGRPRLSATNSTLYFANCSCQHQFPIHSSGVLNIADSSLNIGECIRPGQDTFVV